MADRCYRQKRPSCARTARSAPPKPSPISHTTACALHTGPPMAAVHTRTVHGSARAAVGERSLDVLPGVPQAFLPSQTPKFAEKMPQTPPISETMLM
jgi:hypothetical protein